MLFESAYRLSLIHILEPGEPPTSMSMVIIALEEPVIAGRSAVLKPAVLGVTEDVYKRQVLMNGLITSA